MSDQRRFLLLLNRDAGGTGHRRIARVLDGPQGLGRAASIVPVSNPAEARDALVHCSETTLPVIAGGDGTANLVVRALRECGRHGPLGLLPLGTGNALAYSLGIAGLDRALATLWCGVPRELDLMATDHPDCPVTLLSLSAGFEAAFIAAFAHRRSAGRRLGLFAAATTALHAPCRSIRLVVDGVCLADRGTPVYVAGLYNLTCYGYGRRMFIDGDLGDGWGDARVYSAAWGYWNSLLRPGHVNPPMGIHRRWQSASFTADQFQADGEPLRGGEMRVTLERRAYSILVPGPDGA